MASKKLINSLKQEIIIISHDRIAKKFWKSASKMLSEES